MIIPKNMSNEQSKLVAEIVVLERQQALIRAQVYTMHNKYRKEYC